MKDAACFCFHTERHAKHHFLKHCSIQPSDRQHEKEFDASHIVSHQIINPNRSLDRMWFYLFYVFMRSAVFLFSIGLYFVKIQSRKIVS